MHSRHNMGALHADLRGRGARLERKNAPVDPNTGVDLIALKSTINSLGQAWAAFKSANEAEIAEIKRNGTVSPETKAKMDKIGVDLDQLSAMKDRLEKVELKATDPSWAFVDGTMIRLGSDAQGDVYYFNGTNVVRLAAGTSGQFLKTNGVGANPAWADAASPGLVYLGVGTASGSQITFTNTTLQTGTYSRFMFVCERLVPTTDTDSIMIRTSTDNGANFDTGYSWQRLISGSTTNTGSRQTGQNDISLTATVGNQANENGFSGVVFLYGASAAKYGMITWDGGYDDEDGLDVLVMGRGRRSTAADIDAIRFKGSGPSGTLASGTVAVYGFK